MKSMVLRKHAQKKNYFEEEEKIYYSGITLKSRLLYEAAQLTFYTTALGRENPEQEKYIVLLQG